eukprot:5241563-Ditylum_brightwellii.AAC.1
MGIIMSESQEGSIRSLIMLMVTIGFFLSEGQTITWLHYSSKKPVFDTSKHVLGQTKGTCVGEEMHHLFMYGPYVKGIIAKASHS